MARPGQCGVVLSKGGGLFGGGGVGKGGGCSLGQALAAARLHCPTLVHGVIVSGCTIPAWPKQHTALEAVVSFSLGLSRQCRDP